MKYPLNKIILNYGCIFMIAVIFNSLNVKAQLSRGGTPPSFTEPTLKSNIHSIEMPPINVDSLLQVDFLE